MCGIAGIFRRDGPGPQTDVAAVGRMLDAQAHRGPDGSGLHRIGGAVLGHRRLSIIDLSAAAAQPMPNEDGTLWVTYNGEIYNFPELRCELLGLGHVFRSRTDSEVLVHGYEAWGVPGLLERLRGMFAFALYDAPAGRLILARDRLGIKPLYYAPGRESDVLVFASEVRSLDRSGLVGRDEDPDALLGFLALGSVPAPRTILRDVRCLRPGHYLVADRDGLSERCYWKFPSMVGEDVGEWTERVGERLRDAVARHLVSDVPLGLFLSGGVDSAALAALASRASSAPLHTLTVTFEEPEFTEAALARQVAQTYRTEHHEVLVTGADFLAELPLFLEAMDQPTHDGLNTYFVARAARKVGLTVVLSGVGGDEVFLGYPHHRRLRRDGPFARLLGLPSGPRAACVSAAVAAGVVRGREQWERLGYLQPAPSAGRVYLALRGFFAPSQVARLLGLDRREVERRVADLVGGAEPVPATGAHGLVGVFAPLEFARYLHDQLLRDTDVFAMAHSIEARVPYLDHEIVELAAATPPARRLEAGLNKPLLCRAVGDPLVMALGRRPKRGFTFPLAHWMRTHGDSLAELALSAGRLERRTARAFWQRFRAGRLHWSRAWALTVLGGRRWTSAPTGEA
jgi:asparagine synthase (glutamine-hydrolysing)